MYRRLITVLTAVFLCISATGYAARVYVPQDASTIQAGVDLALEGDTVIMARGIYSENVNVSGKSVILASSFIFSSNPIDVDSTIVEAASSGYAVTLYSDGSDSVGVLGLTVRGDIRVDYCTLELQSSRIDSGGVSLGAMGGAVLTDASVDGDVDFDIGNFPGTVSALRSSLTSLYLGSSHQNSTLDSCVIIGSVTADAGATIDIYDCNVGSLFASLGGSRITATQSLVSGSMDARGGGHLKLSHSTLLSSIAFKDSSVIELDSSIIAVEGGCALELQSSYFGESQLEMNCCAVYGFDAGSLLCGDTTRVTIDTSAVYFVDPRFCDPGSADYHLAANSLCAPANNPCSVLIGAFPVGCDSVATELHVDVSGSDYLGDGSPINPYRTIQFAVDRAGNRDTILVHRGTYDENVRSMDKSFLITSNYIHTLSSVDIDSTRINGGSTDPCMTLLAVVPCSTSVVGLTCLNGSADHGGGVLISRATVHLAHVRLTGNWSNSGGGGLYATDDAYLEMNDCRVDSNSGCAAAGIQIEGGARLLMESCTIEGNVARFGYSGAGMKLSGNGHQLIDSRIAGNSFEFDPQVPTQPITASGGGLISSGDSLIVLKCVFSDNRVSPEGGEYTALEGGGAIVSGNNCLILDNDFLDNFVSAGAGGFEGYAYAYGGALSCGGTTTVRGNRFVGNKCIATAGASGTWPEAYAYGGALVSQSTVLVEENIFVRNRSYAWGNAYENPGAPRVGAQGGAIYCHGGTLRNNSIFSNVCESRANNGEHTSSEGAGIWNDGSATVVNNIISNNSCIGDGTNTAVAYKGNVSLLQYNDIWNNHPSDLASLSLMPLSGNLWADPRFVLSDTLDLRLASNSPCRGAGEFGEDLGAPFDTYGAAGNMTIYVDSAYVDSFQAGTDEYPWASIQVGIDGAVNGDNVLVAPGRYTERISYRQKELTVTSHFITERDSITIAQTIIDGNTSMTPLTNDTGSVVSTVGGAGLLAGFTITGGVGTNGNRYGGGVLADYGIRISHCCICGNSALGGGGIYVIPEVPIRIDSCMILGNQGGGISSIYGWTTIDSCIIKRNSGGGVIARSREMKSLQRLEGPTEATIQHCIIDTNDIGVLLEESSMVLADCRINKNDVGVLAFRDNTASFLNCNVDSSLTCAVQSKGDLTFSDCTFEDNKLGVDLFECHYGTNIFQNCAFLDNSGVIFDKYIADIVVSGCTFVGNSAIFRFQEGSSALHSSTVENSIIAFNSSVFSESSECDSSVYYSCLDVYGNAGGDYVGCLEGMDTLPGYLSADPLFCSPDAGNYQLESNSPCLPEHNDCEVLIGAFGLGCTNTPPTITSPDHADATEDQPFVYVATADDPDGPSLAFTFEDYPDWLTPDADSIFGTPSFGDGDTSFMVIASDGIGSSSLTVSVTVQQISPVINHLFVDGVDTATHVVSDEPQFCWSFSDPTTVQDSFEIAFGLDNDWAYAEMWNPNPFNSPDTCLDYAGVALQNGATYYVHVRAKNGVKWSPWYESSFRMNSPPSAPLLLSPSDTVKVKNYPELCFENSTDPEGDSIIYSLIVYSDREELDTLTSCDSVIPGTDSTCWLIDDSLKPSHWYWWRVRAFDGYEFCVDPEVDSFFTACCGWYTGGYTGNVDCDTLGLKNLQDVTRLIDYIYLSRQPLCCWENGDVNGDGVINLQDVTRLIDHIYLSKAPTAPCP